MAEPEYAVIRLKNKEERRLKSGHLWIYSNEVDVQATPLTALSPGEPVLVEDASGKAMGLGYVNPHSLICVRLLTRDCQRSLNKKLFQERLQRAKDLRDRLYPEPYYRAFFGDSDGLSGLVVDRFGDYLVVQTNTAGMEAMKGPLLVALRNVFEPKAVLWRNDSPLRELERLPLTVEVAHGDWPERLSLVENGVRFSVAATEGQKTGWFYDHRENRKELARWVKGQRVLDVFAYAGGWGLQALAAGAESLTAIDASNGALSVLLENADQQGVADRVQALHGNAFEIMQQLIDEGERFDIVIVDPPAFIKRRKDFKTGLKAYRKLNTLAMRLLQREGLLVSASCSMHLPDAELVDAVRGASRHVDRNAQLVFQGKQGPDHPIHPAIPETQYLKAQFYWISPSL